MLQCHVPQRHPGMPITHDLLSIDIQRCPANSPHFQFRSTHPGFHALDDEISFEFGNRTDDDNHSAAQSTASVDVFAVADKLDANTIQFIQYFEKMPYASGHSVESGHKHDIEFAPTSVGHYFAGPSHVLPTGRSARFFSPLGVQDLVKRTGMVRYSGRAIERFGEMIEKFAIAEGLTGNARSITIRRGKA